MYDVGSLDIYYIYHLKANVIMSEIKKHHEPGTGRRCPGSTAQL